MQWPPDPYWGDLNSITFSRFCTQPQWQPQRGNNHCSVQRPCRALDAAAEASLGWNQLPACRARPPHLIAIHANQPPWITPQLRAYLHRVKMHVAAGLKFTQSSTSVWRLSPSRQRLFAVQLLNRQTLTAEYFQHIIITTTIIMFPAALLLTLGNRTDFPKKKKTSKSQLKSPTSLEEERKILKAAVN